jgi:hypothetical protein
MRAHADSWEDLWDDEDDWEQEHKPYEPEEEATELTEEPDTRTKRDVSKDFDDLVRGRKRR